MTRHKTLTIVLTGVLVLGAFAGMTPAASLTNFFGIDWTANCHLLAMARRTRARSLAE